MEDLLKDFIAEAGEQIEAVGSQLVQFEQDPTDARIIASIFRLVHSIKGTCGFLGLDRLANLAHAAETLISQLREGAPATSGRVSLILSAIDRIRFMLAEIEKASVEPEGSDDDLLTAINSEVGPIDERHTLESEALDSLPTAAEPTEVLSALASWSESAPSQASAPSTIRVSVGTLERMMALVSELVLTRNQLLEITRHAEDEQLKAPLQRLSSLTTDLQDNVMRARMQPIGRLFSNLPRLVRELSAELGKKIALVTEGSDTELDRQLIELLRDPLTHMIRNCADHAIEPPAARRAAGKMEAGTVRVGASHQAGHIVIEISDDGRGLDVDAIRRKALANGLASEAELDLMTNEAVCRFIFAPGFSTAAAVTSVSGRGVGMDVVRENIEAIGGSIGLTSNWGRGTTFSLKIPLTLAIAPALIVESRGHRFALPQHSVVEAVGVHSEAARIENVQGALVLQLREHVLPIADLGQLLGLDPRPLRPGVEPLVVVMRVGSMDFGLIVDAVSDVQEIVVKPLASSLSQLTMFSGNTILGDGAVVLILDPPGVARRIGVDNSSEYSVSRDPVAFVPREEPMRLILFRAGEGPQKAVPLSLISRIEQLEGAPSLNSYGLPIMRHQGRLMPLIDLGNLPGKSPTATRPVLVVGVGGEPMGLLVGEIVDIIEDRLDIEIAEEHEGLLGSTVVHGAMTEILDITHFMRLARPNAFSRGHAKRFHVLVVDDREFFRDMLGPIVSAAGYEVTTASSAREVLSMFDRGADFDAVITDIDMPEMNGYALAQTILADPRRADIPVIALAAHAASAVIEAARTAGMRGAVGKFDRAALIRALAEALDGRGFNKHAIESQVLAEIAL